MANVTILRTVYALTASTGDYLSANQLLVTDGTGGTFWSTSYGLLTTGDGGAIGFLPSTILSLSTISYSNSSTFTSYNISTGTNIQTIFTSLQSLSNSIGPGGGVQGGQLTSTVGGLGTANYISSAQLISTTAGLGNLNFVSSFSLVSTVEGLGTANYISSLSLQSTLRGLNTFGYPSTQTVGSNLRSTVAGLGTSLFISTSYLNSTLVGLGTLNYVSTSQLLSTTLGIRQRYVSTSEMISTVNSLGTQGYVSSLHLVSTIQGLAQSGYVSSQSLVSATQGILQAAVGPAGTVTTANLVSTVRDLGWANYTSSTQLLSVQTYLLNEIGIQRSIRFDTSDSVQIIGGTNNITFCNANNVVYVSSFLMSSITVANTLGSEITAEYFSPYTMRFSTANVNLALYRPYMAPKSIVTLDYYPTILFSKLATGATSTAALTMSTMIQVGQTILSSPVANSIVYVVNQKKVLESGNEIDQSNVYNTPLKIQFSTSLVSTLYTSTFTFVHVMPSSINNSEFQNALHNCNVTPYVSRTNGVFVSVQNLLSL